MLRQLFSSVSARGVSQRRIFNSFRRGPLGCSDSVCSFSSLISKDNYRCTAAVFDGKSVRCTLQDSRTLLLNPTWLWYNAPRFRDPNHNQKTNSALDLFSAPTVKEANVERSGDLRVYWSDGTVDLYDNNFLFEYDCSEDRILMDVKESTPSFLGQKDKEQLYIPPILSSPPSSPPSQSKKPIGKADIPRFTYEKLLSDDETRLRALESVNENGLCIIEGAPTDAGTVLKAASSVGGAIKTIYGMSWDVAVQPKPINIAYAPVMLDFHVDLVYYESAPGLQLLHCKEFSDAIVGGESTFVDGFYAAELLRKVDPKSFEVLTKIPATFEKVHFQREKPVIMRSRQPHITVAPGMDPLVAPVVGVAWAPMFEGVLRVNERDIDSYFKAYKAFAMIFASIEHDRSMVIEYRMKPGDISIFNNRRLLHGRREFFIDPKLSEKTASNHNRVLEGCYVNIDEYKSELDVLKRKFHIDSVTKRVGNRNLF